MVLLTSEIWFPHPDQTHESGILAVGGDLSLERLLLAYNNGIFPWYSENEPILWWCPDERMVLYPDQLHISKSMKSVLRKNRFKPTFNTAFDQVIEACSSIKRENQNGTWLTNEMISAYKTLHDRGIAQSVEVWQKDKLVGGLYGVYLKEYGIFCGESMFTCENNASKFAFIKMIEHFKVQGLKLVDCQVYTSHLESLGAQLVDREVFLDYFRK